MPNLAAISQATTEINRGGWIPPPQALTVSNRPGEIGLREMFLKTALPLFNYFCIPQGLTGNHDVIPISWSEDLGQQSFQKNVL